MPNFLIDEDTDLLAAEFVLGTLDAEERANAQSLLRIDHAFIAMVRIWERRLSELHLMVEPVDPDAKILERIKAKLPQTPQNEAPANARLAAVSPPPSSPPPSPPPPSPEPGVPATPPEPGSEPASQESSLEAAMLAAAGLVNPEAPNPEATPPDATADPDAPEPLDTTSLAAPDVQPSPELRLPEAVTRSERGAADKLPPPAPAKTPDKLPEAPRPPKPPRDPAQEMLHSRARWRAVSVILFVLVVAGAGLVAAWKFVPDRVPARLRPAQLMTSLGLLPNPDQPRASRPAPPSNQFDE
jgi:hypothetical protein